MDGWMDGWMLVVLIRPYFLYIYNIGDELYYPVKNYPVIGDYTSQFGWRLVF